MEDSRPDSSGLLGIADSDFDEIALSDDLAWLRDRIGKFVKGGIYLIAGQPGIGKSTLGIQLTVDLARSGSRTLYILTEQSKEELAQRARHITSKWAPGDVTAALQRIDAEDGINDLETLPGFLSHQVLSQSGKYHGTAFIVLDSVQGHGISTAATKKYRQVYEFCRQCKKAGITVLLVAHVTKRGDIAGPKDLEHLVDCVLVMRKAMAYRPLFVPKNRFGPAILKAVPLEIDRGTTALALEPHSKSANAVARSFLPETGSIEVQAAVSLPAYNSRGKITAPGLPRREIEQLANCISQIQDMNINDLEFTIHCRLPGERKYRGLLGLPLAMALIASYLQKDIPDGHFYFGEVDLFRKVRELPDWLVKGFSQALNPPSADADTDKVLQFLNCCSHDSSEIRAFLPPPSAKLLGDLYGAQIKNVREAFLRGRKSELCASGVASKGTCGCGTSGWLVRCATHHREECEACQVRGGTDFIFACASLDDAMYQTWPELRPS